MENARLLVRVAWSLLLGLTWFSLMVPLLRQISFYGKLFSGKSEKSLDSAQTFNEWLFRVVNHPGMRVHTGTAFRSFYMTLLITNSILLLEVLIFAKSRSFWGILSILHGIGTNCEEGYLVSGPQLLVMVLLQMQATRRLYECYQIHRFSKSSSQHVIVTAGGILFYVLVSLTPVVDPGIGCVQPKTRWWAILPGLSLFFAASYHQHRAHRILARIRDNLHGRRYGVPFGDWFRLVSCPHYLAEILIYSSLAIILETVTQWLCVAWVILNLTITGLRTHRWYHQTFPNYSSLRRRAIIPFIL
mmetsp:Transcript_8706/g.12999  ORF Transcript_8706/g.12999 Transcript_8706/m.12999 type:complete len:302 (-) Transcript_8706:30-935(-)